MKKRYIYICLLVILFSSMLPGAALAKSGKTPQSISVNVYNHSGSALTVLLTNKKNGDRSYLNLDSGVTTEHLLQGMYDYTVTTPCGLETGSWNVTPGRILWISCKYGFPVAALVKAGSCGEMGIYIYGGTDQFSFWPWHYLKTLYSSLQDALNHIEIAERPFIGCWNSGNGAYYINP